MDIKVDEKQLIEDLISRELGEGKSGIDQVKKVIRNEIEKRKNSLQQVTDKIGSQQHDKVSFSAMDHAYIDQKYIECCFELWMQEVASFLKNYYQKNDDLTRENISHDILQDVLNSFDTIQHLHQIPKPLNQLQYYALLTRNQRLIGGNKGKTLLSKFKIICSEQIITCIEFIQEELDFLSVFVDILLTSRNWQVIISELHLHSFCSGDLAFDKLTEGIVNLQVDDYGTEVIALKEAVDRLKDQKNPFLTKMFRRVINDYIKPVETQIKTLDGRSFIETTGKRIVVSDIVRELESFLSSNSNITEVRVVGADILHIDANLEDMAWRGKNVVIFAKTMKIHGKVIWNVSGKDNHHTYPNNAGTGADGHGKQGADGHAGEGGGNVLIVANEIRNAENFTIISHGGRGSKGQDGGNGSVGKDGKGMSISEFKETFPSVVIFVCDTSERRRLFDLTVENIKKPRTAVKTHLAADDYEFIEAKTSQGNEIIFSYCYPGSATCLQAFLLHKGSLGQPGGSGGGHGLGGEGGYNGDVTTDNPYISVYADRGEAGEPGTGGLHGDHGKNGWDVGYTDYQHWANAVFYGEDKSSKLQLVYHDTTWGAAPSDSVWCPYYARYAQICATGQAEHGKVKKYQERNDTRPNRERQHQARAIKQKSISQGQTLAEYSHLYSSVGVGISNDTRSTFDNIMKRALQAMVENSEQQEKVATELKVKRVESAQRDRNIFRYKTATGKPGITSRNITSHKLDIESLIDLLASDAGLDSKFALKGAELNRVDLDRIISEFESTRIRFPTKAEAQNFERLLNEKYRFTVLREVASQLPDYYNYPSNPVVTPESASRYLAIAEEYNSDISHNILGTLSQYLFVDGDVQREKIHNFFNEELRNTIDNESLQRSVGTFVLVKRRSKQVHPSIEKQRVEYQKFLEKKFHSLETFWEPFRRLLAQDKYKDIFALWINRNKNESSRLDLNREIQKDRFLNVLYNLFNRQLSATFDWNNCCEDEEFLEEYNNDIREKGPFSESYRELLAYVFDVNIRLYENQANQIRMVYNHKPSSEKIIHVLYGKNELKQLNLDGEYLKLEEQRTRTGNVYSQILAQTKALKEKQELDDYLKKRTFSTHDVRQINSQCLSQNNCISCTEELDNTESQTWKRTVRAFVLEVGDSEEIHPDVKKHCDEYKKFSQEQERSLNAFFEPFYSELKRHKHVHALWTANRENKFPKSELDSVMKEYNLLNALKNRFDDQLEQEYDWGACRENRNFLDEYYQYICQNDLPSESCSDLRHQFIDRYVKLEEEERAIRDNPCTKIFAKNDTLKLEEESDYFLERQTPYLDSIPSDDECLVREEEDIVKIAKYFSCPEERLQIKERLEKISSQYTGHSDILHHILSRFSNDGRHVSFQELCYLVNSILTFVIRDRKKLNIFRWIVAAVPQKCWIDEVVLLQLENYFRKPLPDKSQWRTYLSKLTNKDILLSLTSKLDQDKSNGRISTQFIKDTLKLLSYVPNEAVSLGGLNLREWPYAVREKYWTFELSKLGNWQKKSEVLSEASYYLLSMENTFGAHLVEKFLRILGQKDRISPEKLTYILSNFSNERWNLGEKELETLLGCRINNWIETFEDSQEERGVARLVELIQGNDNTSKVISIELPKLEIALRNFRKKENATDGLRAGKVERMFNWLSNIQSTAKRYFSKLPAIENSSEGHASSGQATTSTWEYIMEPIGNDTSTSETSDLDVSSEIENPMERINKQISMIIQTTTAKMTKNDYKIFSHLFREFFDSCRDISEKEKFIEETRILMLDVVDKAIELEKGFKLRDTQKLAILALLTNERNTLAQVSTGEGKSLIVVAAAIMKAIYREKVDIITSSSVLAKRDAEDNRGIYRLFGISVSHNCMEDIEKRRAAYSKGQIVYGDLSNFQRDYLLDRFYGKNILGDRTFENVFVDEVDSMLLDKGNNMLYLSHDLPGLDKLESLYVYIWQRVNRPAKTLRDVSSNFDIRAIKDAVLYDLFGLITKEDIKKLDSELDEQQATIIWKRLVAAEILDGQGKMLRENIDGNELEVILSPKFQNYANRLCYLLTECIERNKFIHVPNCFKSFIEQHLEVWINSAVRAANMQKDHDYVLDVDRTGSSQDINPRITIVDRDTGADQANSQWDEALHQFLQLKHGCKLSLQSLKAVFISNVSYLKLYKKLYGVTGTLGSRLERKLLMEIHRVDFISIPTAKPKQFREDRPIFCTDKAEWFKKIYFEATELTKYRKRSVLIICETIDDAQNLTRYLKDRQTENLHTYTRDYEEFDITQGKEELQPGQIIIATNLSGRGTDIKITEGLRIAGGLHICLTYLPKNSRIEQQAFGRVARCGDPGSGRLIIRGSEGQEYNAKILDLKKQRDDEELHRISDLKAYYETQILTEERSFDKFTERYRVLSENLSVKKESIEVRKILMHSCLDKWAFWLDRNSKCMENVTDDQDRNNVEDSLNEFIREIENLAKKDITSWVEEQPVQMIKLGKCFCQVRRYKDAIKLFDKVIKLEPRFAEAAHYYKAFAIVKQIDWNNKARCEQLLQQLKRELREAAKLFEEHGRASIYAAGVIDTIKQHNANSVMQIDTYATQQTNLNNIYCMFSQSIDDILGKPVTPMSFVSQQISKELSETIYEDLLSNGILEKPRVESDISEGALNRISFEFGIKKEELKACLFALKGQKIDEKELKKWLQSGVKLPSREDFWKLLVEENILNSEVKCVIVDVKMLKKVDPSLLHSLRTKIHDKELDQETLECSDWKGIVLHPEQADPQQDPNMEDCLVLEKNALLEVLVGDDRKYKYLKKKGIFATNKKACIDLRKITSKTLPRYDSITLEDFDGVKIARNDAEIILARLVEQQILKKVNSVNGIYRLLTPFNHIDRIQFPASPVYQNAVIGLLSVCFVYRMALERIEWELAMKNSFVFPRLESKPHNKLIYELMNQHIIGSVKLSTEIKDLRNRIRDIYCKQMSRDNLKSMLAQSVLLSEKNNIVELCDCLLAKTWLFVIESSPQSSMTDPLHPYLMEMRSAFDLQYSINSSEYRQDLSPFEDIQKTIAKIFDDRLELAKEDTIQHIVRVLEQSRSPFTIFEVPDGSLKPLTKCGGLNLSTHVDEVNNFTLNGLDQLLRIEENKWTVKMIFNTAILVVIAVIQIVIGFVIRASLNGARASCLFFSEGISDMMFAINLLRSGQFNWKNYLQYKFQRIMSIVITVCKKVFYGIASLFGFRVVRTGIDIGEEAAEAAELGETDETNEVTTETANHIISNARNAGVFYPADGGVDLVVRNYLERLCDDIGSAVLSTITNKIEEHVHVKLETTYQILGKEDAIKFVTDLAESIFNEQSLTNKYLPVAIKISRSVIQVIEDAVKQESQNGRNRRTSLAEIVSSVLALVPNVEDLVQVDNLRRTTDSFLNSLENKLTQSTTENALDQNQGEVRDGENFKRESIDRLNSLVNERVGRIMEQHIVRPILNRGGGCLMGYCERMIKNRHRAYNEGRDNGLSEELRWQYQESQRSAHPSASDTLTEIENYALNEYHTIMNELITKTRNYKLLASLVRENVPMDVSCLKACIPVLLRVSGTTGLTIVAKGRGGKEQRFSSFSVEGVAEEYVIQIELVRNRFQLHGGGVSRCNQDIGTQKNCLYEAVSECMDLKMTRESFSAEVANFIERDPDIQYRIKQEWSSCSSASCELDASHGTRARLHERQPAFKRSKSVEGLSSTQEHPVERRSAEI